MIAVGLIGSNGAGKSAACQYFRQKGFVVISLSDVVRAAASAKGLPLDRDHLVRVGNALKAEHGDHYLAKVCYDQATPTQPVVFDSIRNVAEARFFKENGVILVGIDAPITLRYQRISARQSSTDQVDFETFAAQDARENEGKSSGQYIDAALKECHTVIQNTKDLHTLHHLIDQFLRTTAGEKSCLK